MHKTILTSIPLLIFLMQVCLCKATTISLNWYDGEDGLTGENVANSCNYGGTFNVPTPPSRPGYVFVGWKAKPAPFNPLAFLWANIDTSGFYEGGGINHDGTKRLYYGSKSRDGFECTFYPDSGAENVYDIYGASLCSSTSGTVNVSGNPENTDGQYCWCKAEEYYYGTNYSMVDISDNTNWVLLKSYNNTASCFSGCGVACGNDLYNAAFRRALYGVQ